ncbi:MAG: hypothetical protein EBT06_00720 [Gammaproteobacteria bacterium]|nr:hypothetical protein [Gammaproteobacteria bacterium]NBT43446.1 hypothetical protein [Gammaproteobacteria bacterium]NBY22150.1 hypothetical protein [Gammaproteobacteria bacterium]NDE34615.1 hypothetical protein [Gammaproteobacteria bacterium]NDE55883.1 hypothetical protein [Gammaproteobacteria bacterium]
MAADILIVNTNPLLNLVHQDVFKPAAIHRVQGLKIHAEGKGVNVARVLVRLGHRVNLTGFAGGHSGAWLREIIKADGIEDSFIPTKAPMRMGFMASAPEETHPTTFLPDGFKVLEEEITQLLERVAALIEKAGLVIISGSVPDPLVASAYPKMIAMGVSLGIPIWLDAHGKGLEAALGGLLLPQLAKPNRDEFQEINNWEGVPEVHITDGPLPIEVRTQTEGHWRVTPPALREVNPVGCGDCYLAGLAHGSLKAWSIQERLRFAAAAGSANARRPDVAMITPSEIDQLIDQVEVKMEPENPPLEASRRC